ncbi:hypothetical protein A9404_12120 [Halothiobacillus diazotrophicus]|uniref:HTH lysR-type domain-containing protein n=1 Tax=Halothiobacillus diazotrophicus TaxID=1860122 RepID=A0A191ZJF7_9GAMM|nr:LysR family transcriptional regulator [Halothiobacillus diazotrophicus]ANJ68019.1 hypothetical protein A9404_12120 [Halothiobacillus diazotrophicus]
MDDLRAWRWLIGVIELGGLQAAAKEFHRTPSTLSHAIKQLEAQTGLSLVDYSGRRLVLTEVGRLLTDRIRPVLRDLDSVHQVVTQFARGIEPVLSVAIDQIIPLSAIAPALAHLACTFPHTRLEMYETVLGGGPARLQAGEVGLYLGTQTVMGFSRETVGEIHLVACAAVDHPLQRSARETGETISEAQLRAHRQIVIRDSAPGRMTNGSWLAAEQRFTVDHLHTAIGLIEAGWGFAWLPDSLIAARPGIAPLPLGCARSERAPLHLVVRPDFVAGIVGAAFVEALRSGLAMDATQVAD